MALLSSIALLNLFLPHAFHLFSETILRVSPPEFNIFGHNLDNTKYSGDTVLMAEPERNFLKLLDLESKGKNQKKANCLIVSKSDS